MADAAAAAPLVGIIMGSDSDWETLKPAADLLDTYGIAHEVSVVSAHRTPDRMYAYAKGAAARGLQVIIAGAGGAAHLPGMVSALTPLPVLGVPVPTKTLHGVDSLLSIVQMPPGIPTATFAIGAGGAVNAAAFALRILALHDPRVEAALESYRQANEGKALDGNARVQAERAKART